MSKSKVIVPEAKAALDQFKMQAASEVGVSLNQNGYNGNLTSKQAGSIGGQMVKKMTTSRQKKYTRIYRTIKDHMKTITYNFSFII